MTVRVRTLVDLALGTALFVTMAVCGTHYVRVVISGGGHPEFFQGEFGPAVMEACGRGYVAPDGVPALGDFLAMRRDRFSCTDLPQRVATRPLTGPQATWKYLLGATAIWWRAFGISWSGLVPLSGVFFGAYAALLYTLCRLLANPILAALAVVGTMTSPLHFTELPHLRDYSKAPFMMGLVLILALTLAGARRPARVLWCAAFFGAALGIGIGFRNDLLIMIPAFVLVLATLPGGVAAVKTKLIAAGVAAVTFMLAAAPVLSAYGAGGGASMSHVALLGLSTPFDQRLGVEGDRAYEFGYEYSDSYVAALITDYAVRRQGATGPIALSDRTYDAAGSAMVREVFRLLPADLLARGYAAALNVITLPSSNSVDVSPPPYLAPGFVLRAYSARARLIRNVPWIWTSAVPLALVVAAALDLRIALVVSAVLLYLAAYPAVQFHERHFFHLNCVSWIALAFLGQQCLRGLRSSWRPASWTTRGVIESATRATAFLVVVVVGMVTPLAALRHYQDGAVRASIAARLAAPRTAVPIRSVAVGPGRVILEPAETLPAERRLEGLGGIVTSELLIVDVIRDRCPFLTVDLTLRYSASDPALDFSHRVIVGVSAVPATTTTVLAPVFFYSGTRSNDTVTAPGYRLQGLELPEGEAPCVAAVSRVNDPAQFPLLLGGLLSPTWREATMHQTIAAVETRPAPREARIYTVPPLAPVAWDTLDAHLIALDRADVLAQADEIRMPGPGRWTMDGIGGIGGRGPFLYLIQLKPRALTAGEQFVVEGRLRSGGILVGILRHGDWLMDTEVLQPGPFVVVLTVPTEGEGSVVVANDLTGASLRNSFDITRSGWRRPQ